MKTRNLNDHYLKDKEIYIKDRGYVDSRWEQKKGEAALKANRNVFHPSLTPQRHNTKIQMIRNNSNSKVKRSDGQLPDIRNVSQGQSDFLNIF